MKIRLILIILMMTGIKTYAQDDAKLLADSPVVQKTSYPFLGFVVGSPCGLSLTGGINTENLIYRLTAGWTGMNAYGAQAEIGFKLNTNQYFSDAISVSVGIIRAIQSDTVDIGVTQPYVGVAYNADYSGFFLQFGLGAGFKASPPNPQLLIQAGYLFDFK